MVEIRASENSSALTKFKLFCFAGFGGTAPMLLELITTLSQKSKGVSIQFDSSLFVIAALIAFVVGGIVGYAVSYQEKTHTTPLQALMTGISAPALIMGAMATNQPVEAEGPSLNNEVEEQVQKKNGSFQSKVFAALFPISLVYAQESQAEEMTTNHTQSQNTPSEEIIKVMLPHDFSEKLPVPIRTVDQQNRVLVDSELKPGESVSFKRSEIKYFTVGWIEDTPGRPLNVEKRINVSDLNSNNILLNPTYAIKKTTVKKCRRIFLWKTTCVYTPQNEYVLNGLIANAVSETN